MPNLLWLTDLFVKKLILIHFISIPSSYAFFFLCLTPLSDFILVSSNSISAGVLDEHFDVVRGTGLHVHRGEQKHRKDVSNFDKQFTSEKLDLTPTDKLFMMNLDQNEFLGFSFLNPEFVQHV